MLLTNLAGQTPPVRKLSVPLATNQFPFAVVVLTPVLEFFFVITAGLPGAQRFRDREHGFALWEERLLPGSRRRRSLVGDDRLGHGRLNDRGGRSGGCRADGPSLRLDDGSFDERGMPCRQIEKWKVQSDDEVLQLQVAAQGRKTADFARHDQGLDLPLEAEAPLTLKSAKVPHFRIYDLRSTYATRLSAGGVADEWVTQLLRQGDAKVFKKYSQMKLQMKREALQKLNRAANESAGVLGQTES